MYLFQLKKIFQLSSGWVTTYYKSSNFRQVRMQDNITAIAWKPVFKVLLRIWRQLLQHFSPDVKYCQYRAPFTNLSSLVQMLHLWGSPHASLLKNSSWISVLKSLFICLTWVKTWRGFAKTAWLCQTSSCYTASS